LVELVGEHDETVVLEMPGGGEGATRVPGGVVLLRAQDAVVVPVPDLHVGGGGPVLGGPVAVVGVRVRGSAPGSVPGVRVRCVRAGPGGEPEEDRASVSGEGDPSALADGERVSHVPAGPDVEDARRLSGPDVPPQEELVPLAVAGGILDGAE